MGQAFDRDGNVLGEATGATKREVFDKLTEQFKDAHEIRVRSVEPPTDPRAQIMAQLFHETYERLAPQFGYETREASRKPWADVPEKNKRLMIAVCAELLPPTPPSTLRDHLAATLNRYSAENGSNTPDFILADFLLRCLEAFDLTSRSRERWYGRSLSIGGGDMPVAAGG